MNKKYVVGFLSDVVHPLHQHYNSSNARMWRILAMDNYLKTCDAELLIYSRYDINPAQKTAQGYIIDNNQFKCVDYPIPQVSGNWFYGSQQANNTSGLNKYQFYAWMRKHHYKFYADEIFDDWVSNKWRAYQALSRHRAISQPFTEAFVQTKPQLETLLEKYNKLFIKPVHGAHGDDIFVVNGSQSKRCKWHIAYYHQAEVNELSTPHLNSVLGFIDVNKKDDTYIIQQAINLLYYHQGPFIIRAIAFNDSQTWQWNTKVVATEDTRDVANTNQGCENYTVDKVFNDLFGDDAVAYQQQLDQLIRDLCHCFDTLMPNEVMEIAYDIVLDEQLNFVLLECNTQPGLVKPEMINTTFCNDIFNLDDFEQTIFSRYIMPHGEAMAKFLLNRLQQRQ